MHRFQQTAVREKFDTYPVAVRPKLLHLRTLILDTAAETDGVESVEETLKWQEPSYLTRGGSTIRIGWKKSNPDHYAMYFNCNTSLVETFKEIYRTEFEFEGKRAIRFHTEARVPEAALKHCVSMSLQYHRIKHLPLLGQ